MKTQRLTISPFLPTKSHQPLIRCLGGGSVLTRRKLGGITTAAAPIFQGKPVVTRREIKTGRITRNCVENDGGTEEEEEKKSRGLVKESVWEQMKEIVKFTGPAMGMWVCGPLMSLIDTVVIGQGSSVELAALGTLLYINFNSDFFFFCIFLTSF